MVTQIYFRLSIMLVPALIAWVLILTGEAKKARNPDRDQPFLQDDNFKAFPLFPGQPTFVGRHDVSSFHTTLRELQKEGEQITAEGRSDPVNVFPNKESESGEQVDMGQKSVSIGGETHWQENGKKGDSISETKNTEHDEKIGHKDKHIEKKSNEDQHHHKDGAEAGEYFKEGTQQVKKKHLQGYHNSHHKDEKKEIDSYYSNNHEEGQTIHFGKHNHNRNKENFVKQGGKWFKVSQDGGQIKTGSKVDGKDDNRDHKQYSTKNGGYIEFNRGTTYLKNQPKQLN